MPVDPITLIITAIVAGATAGLQDTVKTAVVDAYNQLKSYLCDNYQDVDVAPLEAELAADADATAAKQQLETQLTHADAGNDLELLTKARSVAAAKPDPDDGLINQFAIAIAKIRTHGSATFTHITTSGSATITDVTADEGITATDITADGDVNFSHFTAGKPQLKE